MSSEATLLLRRSVVEQLLSLSECIDAMENVFRLQGEGKLPAAGILGLKTSKGGLHVKTAVLSAHKSYIVAKLNTNFAENRQHFGRPTIQGIIALFDAENGRALALLDSIEITIKRTAAATALAAKYLAPKKFFGRDDLRLWRPRSRSSPSTVSGPSAHKSLRLRCRSKRIITSGC